MRSSATLNSTRRENPTLGLEPSKSSMLLAWKSALDISPSNLLSCEANDSMFSMISFITSPKRTVPAVVRNSEASRLSQAGGCAESYVGVVSAKNRHVTTKVLSPNAVPGTLKRVLREPATGQRSVEQFHCGEVNPANGAPSGRIDTVSDPSRILCDLLLGAHRAGRNPGALNATTPVRRRLKRGGQDQFSSCAAANLCRRLSQRSDVVSTWENAGRPHS